MPPFNTALVSSIITRLPLVAVSTVAFVAVRITLDCVASVAPPPLRVVVLAAPILIPPFTASLTFSPTFPLATPLCKLIVPLFKVAAAAFALVVLLNCACVALRVRFAAEPPEPPLSVDKVLVISRPAVLLFKMLAFWPLSSAVAVLPPTVPCNCTPLVPPVPLTYTPLVVPVAVSDAPSAAVWLFTTSVFAKPATARLDIVVSLVAAMMLPPALAVATP